MSNIKPSDIDTRYQSFVLRWQHSIARNSALQIRWNEVERRIAEIKKELYHATTPNNK